jgi:hypothetical protein
MGSMNELLNKVGNYTTVTRKASSLSDLSGLSEIATDRGRILTFFFGNGGIIGSKNRLNTDQFAAFAARSSQVRQAAEVLCQQAVMAGHGCPARKSITKVIDLSLLNPGVHRIR